MGGGSEKGKESGRNEDDGIALCFRVLSRPPAGPIKSSHSMPPKLARENAP